MCMLNKRWIVVCLKIYSQSQRFDGAPHLYGLPAEQTNWFSDSDAASSLTRKTTLHIATFAEHVELDTSLLVLYAQMSKKNNKAIKARYHKLSLASAYPYFVNSQSILLQYRQCNAFIAMRFWNNACLELPLLLGFESSARDVNFKYQRRGLQGRKRQCKRSRKRLRRNSRNRHRKKSLVSISHSKRSSEVESEFEKAWQ